MANSWTGGQYSCFRCLFGLYLFVHFLYLSFWAPELFSRKGMLPDAGLSPLVPAFPNILAIADGPVFVTGLCAVGAIAAIFFAAGYGDKIAALIIWYALACLLGRNPLITNPSLPYAGWMLLAHLFIPPAPFGSVHAWGRADPRGNWCFPPGLFLAAWLILALSYSYSGYTKLLSPSWVAGDNIHYVLTNPLARDWILRDLFLSFPPVMLKLLTWFILLIELCFAPMAIFGKLRPWIWSGMLFVQFGFVFLLNFPDLTIAMLLFHFFTFDPGWLRAKSMQGTTIFYDGTCALCHASVRFLLSEEREGTLRFAPIQSDLFSRTLTVDQRSSMGDTFVTVLPDGTVLTEADGAIYLLDGLGGIWRIAALTMNVVPQSVRNWAYHFVGSRRYRMFGNKAEHCPIVPPDLRTRFLD